MREIRLKQFEFGDLSVEVLFRGGSLRFKAHGFSMTPFIQDGDILTVLPMEFDDFKIGNIVFYCSQGNGLVAHRIVSMDLQDDQTLLMMRGDSMYCDDGWIRSEQVLGRVVSLDRGQKVIRLDKGFWSWMMHLWVKIHPIGPLLIKLAVKVKQAVSLFLRKLP